MAPIDAYKKAADQQLRSYRASLLSVKASGFELALTFRTWQIMSEELKTPGSVLVFDKLGPEPKFGLRGADRWTLEKQHQAGVELAPASVADPDGSRWPKLIADYISFGGKLQQDRGFRTRYTEDRARGVGYLIQENPDFFKVMRLIATQLVQWAEAQPVTRQFLAMPPEVGYVVFLSQSKDTVALLRMAQLLPLDVEHTAVDIPTAVEVAEFLISLIPYVGNAVAAYEAYTGENLFGYHLTDVERAILGASLLLPVLGRFAKAGRAMYTEARLVKLYGRDAAGWAKAMNASSQLAQDAKKLAALKKAEQSIRTTGRLDAQLASDAAKAVDVIQHPASGGVSRAVDQRVTDALARLQQASAKFASLDAFAMERVLLKGPNAGHLKGQILEELVESRVVPWLQERWGRFALALDVPAGKQIEFIPGHIIRDLEGKQITDGALAFRDNLSRLNILAVFECKAGPEAARELSVAKVGKLTQADELLIRSAAKDELRELREEARLAGKPFNTTLDELIRTYKRSEAGGQIRRDIERLAGADIRIGNVATEIVFSPTKTKFFGVVPAGLDASLMARLRSQLEAEKVTFELLAAEVTTGELNTAESQLMQLAEQFAAGPVPPPGAPPTP